MENWASKFLKECASHIQYGNFSSESELFEIEIAASNRLPISKNQICKLFNTSNLDIDKAVKQGTIPKGRKRIRHKELYWFLDDILDWAIKIKLKQNGKCGKCGLCP
jgi:hypothetical protein